MTSGEKIAPPESLSVNQLVTVTGREGTHTIRQAPEPGGSTDYLVDVFGQLLEFPGSQLTAHPGSPDTNSTHWLHTGPEPSLHTASVLNRARDVLRGDKLGTDRAAYPRISDLVLLRDTSYQALASIKVTPRHNGVDTPLAKDGLTFDVVLSGNAGLTARPYDLVPILLERPGEIVLDTVIVLTPTAGDHEANIISFTANYSLAQLAGLLGIVLPDSVEAQMKAIQQELPEVGVKAEWRAYNGSNNATNHASGGLRQKDHTGKIRLVPMSLETLERAERVRVIDWSLAEDLQKGRPVFDTFADILQSGPGKEMATTLEAEAEYVLPSEEAYRHVVDRLNALVKADKQEQAWMLGCRLDSEARVYTDTYYDIFAGKTCKWGLLSRRIVLRHRSVADDKGGTFLLAVKGNRKQRTVRSGPTQKQLAEFIRLTAQVQIKADASPERLRDFLTDVSTDNAVGRILADAATDRKAGPGIPEAARPFWQELSGSWAFMPALVVTSVRRKYVVSLVNSVTVEITVDSATAKPLFPATSGPATSPTVYSFELGVGHPALVTADTSAVSISSSGSNSNGSGRPAEVGAPKVTRPYHVPADLTNALFAKADYVQFRELCGNLFDHWLLPIPGAVAVGDLVLGGNKAVLLAQKLGLIK